MFWVVVLVIIAVWALGFGFAGSTVGYAIHILLAAALLVLVLEVLKRRRI